MVFSQRMHSLLTLVLIMLLGGCAKEGPQTLDEETTIMLLADLHIARAAVMDAPVKQRDSIFNQLFVEICSRNKVDTMTARLTLEDLSTQPDAMEATYNQVIPVLEAMRISTIE